MWNAREKNKCKNGSLNCVSQETNYNLWTYNSIIASQRQKKFG